MKGFNKKSVMTIEIEGRTLQITRCDYAPGFAGSRHEPPTGPEIIVYDAWITFANRSRKLSDKVLGALEELLYNAVREEVEHAY